MNRPVAATVSFTLRSEVPLRFFLVSVLGLWVWMVPGLAAPPREYLVKAAFVFNFTKFVEWPENSFQTPGKVGLCILGEDPFQSALTSMTGKIVRGRTVAVNNIQVLEDASSCQVLFVSESEHARLAEILLFSTEHNQLTVSDIADFAKLGGVIGLVTRDDKIRFEINLTSARRAGLSISSNLLKLATVIDNDA